MAMRAVAVMAWAWAVMVGAMASGCYINEEAYGCFDPEPLPAGECWVDKDCPYIECHGLPSCIEGQCHVLAQTKPNTCKFGVCTEDAVCVPCVADAECEKANSNECYSMICGEGGLCVGTLMLDDDKCRITEGTCRSGACIPR